MMSRTLRTPYSRDRDFASPIVSPLILTIALFAQLFLAANVFAADEDGDGVQTGSVIDQQVNEISRTLTNLGSIGPERILAQTFTAGVSGDLIEVNLAVACSVGDLVVQILSVDSGGRPSGFPLASMTDTTLGNSNQSFRTFAFTNPARITAGTQYAIVLDTTDRDVSTCWVNLGPESETAYDGGSFYERFAGQGGWELVCDFFCSGDDLPFQTIVEPTPQDNCPDTPNADQANADGDAAGDACDDFPSDPSETTDTDGDGVGNNADDDDDNDGLADAQDAWPQGRFDDLDPATHFAFQFIEKLERSGVTGGCGGNNYCPDDSVTRAQMAVFLERGMRGSGFVPPAAAGNLFLDVAANDFAAAFIEQLFADGITGGCGGNNYCPNDNVTRGQMAVFLLRAKFGSGYSPPPAVGVFADAPLGSFAVDWIEALAAEGITGGCGSGNYCPGEPVTRGQMAVFLVRAFGL